MTHALIESGQVAEWPLPRERIAEIMAEAIAPQVEMLVGEDGEPPEPGPVEVCLPANLEGVDLTEYGIVAVEPVAPPSALPGQTATEIEPAFVGGVLTQQWALAGDIAAVKAALLADLANRRWQAEEGGTTFGGNLLATDRVSQNKLMGAYIKAAADPDYSVPNWKVAPGVFVTMNAATIAAAGDAVAAHVQSCFDHEAALSAEIAAAVDVEALAAIDIEADWP